MLLVIRYPIGLEAGALSIGQSFSLSIAIAGLGPLDVVGSSFDSISCPCSPVLSSAGSSAWLLALSTLAFYCSNSVAENGTSILVRWS